MPDARQLADIQLATRKVLQGNEQSGLRPLLERNSSPIGGVSIRIMKTTITLSEARRACLICIVCVGSALLLAGCVVPLPPPPPPLPIPPPPPRLSDLNSQGNPDIDRLNGQTAETYAAPSPKGQEPVE